jgi:diacylglycerol kinase (ATP)
MLNIKPAKELRRLRLAFGFSVQGLRTAWGESAFRLEVYGACAAIPLAFWVGQSKPERAVLIGSIFLVMIAELLNTAVEKTVNRVSLDIHPLSKEAKDIGSAAVLIAILNALVVWCVVLWS